MPDKFAATCDTSHKLRAERSLFVLEKMITNDNRVVKNHLSVFIEKYEGLLFSSLQEKNLV